MKSLIYIGKQRQAVIMGSVVMPNSIKACVGISNSGDVGPKG